MDTVYETIRNISVFIILTTIVNNILSENSYKKYVRFFSGLAMIIIIIKPVFNIMYGGENIFSGIKINALKIDRDELEEELKMYGETAEDKIEEEYRKVIDESLDVIAAGHDLVITDKSINIDMDSESETFGMIEAVFIKTAEKGSDNKTDISNIQIDSDGNVYSNAGKVKQDKLAEEIAEYYGIDKNKVEVY